MSPTDILTLEAILANARKGDIETLSIQIYRKGGMELEWLGEPQDVNAVANTHFAQLSQLVANLTAQLAEARSKVEFMSTGPAPGETVN